jgi:hypothetical protein
MDQMYGASPFGGGQALPSYAPTTPTYTMPQGQSTVGSAYWETGDYLANQGWQKVDEWWMPPGKEGEVYRPNEKAVYEFRGGRWQRWQPTLQPIPFAGGQFETLEEMHASLLASVKGLPGGKGNELMQFPGATFKDFLEKLVNGESFGTYVDQFITPAVREQAQMLLTPEEYEPESTVENWNESLSTLIKQLDTGEMTIEDLANSDNIMAGWLQTVLDQSVQTGDILGNFIDENGNLAPELQEMQNWFATHQDNQEEWQKFNRDLAMHAISQGRSVNSGYYSEHVANSVAGYAAGVTEQATQVIQREIQDQWNYVANSLKEVLKMAGQESQLAQFEADMQLAYDKMLQDYSQQIQLLAQAIGENKAAQFGDIFTGILSGILNIGLSFL